VGFSGINVVMVNDNVKESSKRAPEIVHTTASFGKQKITKRGEFGHTNENKFQERLDLIVAPYNCDRSMEINKLRNDWDKFKSLFESNLSLKETKIAELLKKEMQIPDFEENAGEIVNDIFKKETFEDEEENENMEEFRTTPQGLATIRKWRVECNGETLDETEMGRKERSGTVMQL